MAANQPQTTPRLCCASSGAGSISSPSSEGWGIEKPAPEFFANVVRAPAFLRRQIAYVGDRLDNDVLPANRAGMVSVFLRRGPWGYLHATRARGGRGADPDRLARRAPRGAARCLTCASDWASTRTRSRTACRSSSAASRSTSPRGLAGHSDGDVLAHALLDALLGAAGLADIGALFPSSDPRWHGASSLDLLARAYADVRDAGFELVNADVVLVGEEPRLAPHRLEMRARLAGALGVDPALIAVRATTTDGLGFTGRRRRARRAGGRARPARRYGRLTTRFSTRTSPSRSSAATASGSSFGQRARRIGDEPQRARAALPERAFERSLPARRREAHPA